ncbi:hypothetical protein [Aurantibacillus circumpalustris]|uniref:hypothetical protein n=1 Tax=Aurantibacillus circumpalustris TaxID=3036359 RepID=UPI00295C20EE|nr:hypothetical protein [Aurantibacillus circumpalustris]
MKKIIIILAAVSTTALFGREKVASERPSGSSSGGGNRVMANCAAPNASQELRFNNVRTIIFSGGDMWWDRNGNGNAFYYIPSVANRNTGVSSSFAGSIWLGGLDAGGQLKIAAMTYRQSGIDFWSGPLDTINASADPAVCAKYDQIYSISRAEVEEFSTGVIPSAAILNWPGNGDVSKRQGKYLAPFVDVDNDGVYDPAGSRDYPAYDIDNKAEKDNLGFCKTKLFGDNTLFWVFNDNGGIHTETQGVPIGVEVRAQAFAFKTNDEINNMTFYSYEVFNRSSFQLNQTYFTIWNDADLGYFLDDYVGCDVKRGLGYIYNADPFDETAMGTNGYQDYPPSLGCDFFKGPLADLNDGIDNDQDNGTGLLHSGIDEAGETIQMSRFTYYNNNYGAFPPQTVNPDIAIHYYNYMTGRWKDSSPFTVGGNAYGGTTPSTFVYDGNPVTGTGWTEKGSGNPPGDRRFLQSAGPFTLKPGAVNEITFGMPWAQSSSKGGNIQSLDLMFNADDKAQALFDNCFKLLDGPEAPVMTIQEMNNELIFYLVNEKGKNNYKQFNNDYAEEDISIVSDPSSSNLALRNPDKFYKFEGYIVYQVKNEGITSTDLSDPTKAKVVFQCDIENGHARLTNFEQDNIRGGFVPTVKVEGEDKGIRTSFKITDDAFSTLENRKLVNNKQYFFLCVAYAFNEYLPYKPDISPSQSSSENYLGQKRPYLEGRKYKRASGTPHNTDLEKGGTLSQSFYGFGPKITRVEGQGNGGNMLTLTKASEDEIVTNFFKADITYENAQGPLNIKVVDPLNVKDSKFSFKFINYNKNSTGPTTDANAMIPVISSGSVSSYKGTINTLNVQNTSWELKDLVSGKKYYSTEINSKSALSDTIYQTIKVGNEFYFPDLGFSVNIKQVADPGERINRFTDFKGLTEDSAYTGPSPGSLIGASISYLNGQSNWLNSVPDFDFANPYNWILSGSTKSEGLEDAYYKLSTANKVQAFYDPDKQYGQILGGTWAPYPLTASYYSVAPGPQGKYPGRCFGGPGFDGRVWEEDENLKALFGQLQTSTNSTPGRLNTDLRKLSSTLVVFTKDKSKWTRCVVLEMQEKSILSEGNAIFFSPRKHASVDKDGKPAAVGSGTSSSSSDPNFISETSMGWFPGYAINIETGERLNMAFGEDSYQKENNGNDMIWNPTANYDFPYRFSMGGKHFVYVFGGNSIKSTFYSSAAYAYKWIKDLDNKESFVGPYDYGKRMITILKSYFTTEVFSDNKPQNGGALDALNCVERDIMWVSIPMPAPGLEFKTPDLMPSDVRVQINVTKPYRYGWSGIANLPYAAQPYGTVNTLLSVNNPSLLTDDIKKSDVQNNNFPMYTFNTNDISTLYQQEGIAKNAMDRINIVPNPYYGSSAYETGRADNRIRITNLPSKCTIKIFTMNGTLIRTIKRDVTDQEDLYTGVSGGVGDLKTSKRSSFVEWDLKNQNNISVASGLYIFHIDAPGVGEKILKWFGVMRPLDVQSY